MFGQAAAGGDQAAPAAQVRATDDQIRQVVNAANLVVNYQGEMQNFRNEMAALRARFEGILNERADLLRDCEQLKSTVARIEMELNEARAEHRQAHLQVQTIEGKLSAAPAPTTTPDGGKSRMADLKSLAPEKLAKVDDGPNWRDWSHKAKVYLSKLIKEPKMKDWLGIVEGHQGAIPVSYTHLTLPTILRV